LPSAFALAIPANPSIDSCTHFRSVVFVRNQRILGDNHAGKVVSEEAGAHGQRGNAARYEGFTPRG
jgi:hypothetical protein